MSSIKLWAALLILAASGPAAAQSKTPADVVHEYVAAIQAEGLTATSRFIHPDDLARFKQMFGPLLHSDKKLDGSQNFRTFIFGSEVSVERVEAMSAAEFMDAFMKRVGGMLPEFKLGDMTVIGSVPEGELIHVLARGSAEVQDIKVDQLEVITLKPHDGGWKIKLDSKLEGLAAAFEKAAK